MKPKSEEENTEYRMITFSCKGNESVSKGEKLEVADGERGSAIFSTLPPRAQYGDQLIQR